MRRENTFKSPETEASYDDTAFQSLRLPAFMQLAGNLVDGTYFKYAEFPVFPLLWAN